MSVAVEGKGTVPKRYDRLAIHIMIYSHLTHPALHGHMDRASTLTQNTAVKPLTQAYSQIAMLIYTVYAYNMCIQFEDHV